MSKKLRIAVLFGGISNEHEVSLASANNVIAAMDPEKYDVVKIGITKDGRWVAGDKALHYLTTKAEPQLLPVGMDKVLAEANTLNLNSFDTVGIDSAEKQEEHLLRGSDKSIAPSICSTGLDFHSFDVVFPVVHGACGEDGAIQGLCKLAQVPVVGCGILSSAVAMDKIMTNQVMQSIGIDKPRWGWCTSKDAINDFDAVDRLITDKLAGYPAFVKPANSGSSVGVHKIHNKSEIAEYVRDAAKHDRRLLFEEAIVGKEVEIAVLGEEQGIFVSSVIAEIVPGHEFYDYEAKYIDDAAKTIVPANLPASVLPRMQDIARRAFRAIDGTGMSRIDFFYIENEDKLLLNEINTIPGFTQISMYPVLMRESGIPYSELIERLINAAIWRFKE